MSLQEDSNMPLGRILIGTIVAFILIGFGINWFAGIENEKKAEELYAQSQDAFNNKKLESSLVLIERALKLKEKPHYLKVKLNVLMNQNKVYESEQVLEKLIAYEPKNAHFRNLSALLAYNENNLSKAEEKYQEAITLEPHNAEYQVKLANIYFMRDERGKAKTLYERIIQTDPNYKNAWQQYITVFSNSGLYDEALHIAQRAIQQFPKDSNFYFLLAVVYDHKGNKQEATAAYLKSLELEPMPGSIAAKRIFEITGKRVPLHLENMDSEQVPFENQGKLMFVSAKVNENDGTFLVDTGASLSIIYKSKAEKYHIKASPFRIEAETAGGIVQAPIGYASVQLGKNKVQPVLFAILPDPQKMQADGIIGMNFLENFRIEIDKNNQKLTLTH